MNDMLFRNVSLLIYIFRGTHYIPFFSNCTYTLNLEFYINIVLFLSVQGCVYAPFLRRSGWMA